MPDTAAEYEESRLHNRYSPAVRQFLFGLCSIFVCRAQDLVTFKDAVNLVPVTFTVTGAGGRPVQDLTINDFLVFDDGRPADPTDFEISR